MWLLNWLPDWIFHLILLVGLLGLVASWVLKKLPFFQAWGLQVQVAAIILTLVGVWYEGGIAKDAEYRERIAALQLKVAQADAAAAEANTKLAEAVAKAEQDIHDITNANQKKLAALSGQLNKTCTIGQDVLSVLNDAAKNRRGAK